MKKNEIKTAPQPQPETELMKLEAELGMTQKEALDKVLKIATKSKDQIAKGMWYTPEQVALHVKQRIAENEAN